VVLALGFFWGRSTIKPSIPSQPPKPDTVFVEKAIPKYITKYVTKEGKTDTVYTATVDTTLDNVQIQVSYEAGEPLPLGVFSIRTISNPLIYCPLPDYYLSFNLLSSINGQPPIYEAGAGRYLFNSRNIKVGAGVFAQRLYDGRINYGLSLRVSAEF